MIHRALVPVLFLLFLPAALSPATPSPVSPNPRLTEILRLPALQPTDWHDLFSIAEAGDPEAEYWLGRIYQDGRLLPADKAKSDYWYRKAASQSYARAEFVLCSQQSEPDSMDSERCFLRAAESGVPEMQFWLGVAFDQHLWFGVTDEVEALYWFRKSADGGDSDAQAELGRQYETGDGVEQDFAQAAYWYRRAAEHVPDLRGAGQGRNNLGLLYLSGRGVPRDNLQACMWFILADAKQNIDAAQREMTREQIISAPHLAADWKTQHPDPAIY